MNRTKIEWCDYTWNPVTGCLHGCKYCYARRLASRLKGRYGYPKDDPFRPTFHPDRLKEPYKLKKPSKIFVVDMGDLFGEWVPDTWIEKIMKVVEDNPRHTFQFLTKNPERMYGYPHLKNAWFGVTINNLSMVNLVNHLWCLDSTVGFVSFEPLHEDVAAGIDLLGVDWIIIGAQTRPNVQPEREWVEHLIEQARERNIPIFLKDNLKWSDRIQEFPMEVK